MDSGLADGGPWLTPASYWHMLFVQVKPAAQSTSTTHDILQVRSPQT